MSIMTTVRNESSGCTGHAFLADDVEGERNIRKKDSIFFLLFILFSSCSSGRDRHSHRELKKNVDEATNTSLTK